MPRRGAELTGGASSQALVYQQYREVVAGQRRPRTQPRDRVRSWALVLGDMAAVLAGLAVSGFAAGAGGFGYDLAVLLPLWALLNKLLGLYDRDASVIDTSTLHELPKIAESLAIGGGLIFVLGPTAGVSAARHQALAFVVVAGPLTVVLRVLARRLVARAFEPERAVIVGSGTVAQLLADKLHTHPRYGVNVVGYIDQWPHDGHDSVDPPLLGDLRCFRDVLRELRVERVIVAFSTLDHEDLLDTVRATNALGLKLSIVPRLFEVLGRSLMVDEVEGMSLLAVRRVARSRSALAAKRAMDVVGALVLLALCAPVLAVIALAIKLTSPGPVLFSQVRIGRDHQPFTMLKFRTMVDGADALKDQLADLNQAQYPMFKIAEDPRVTKVGRFMRRTSIDELPQLWNVLRGEMSLVGPRPLVPSEDAKIIGWHRARLDISPGLTGPWQVMGRNRIPLSEMVKLDYRYIADWSLWNDMKLLVKTAPVVFLRQGL